MSRERLFLPTLRYGLTALAGMAFSGLVIGLVVQPYQWISELGFRLQSLWFLQEPAGPRLWQLLPWLGTLLFLLLAWGPLAAGRGGGITGVLVLQGSPLEQDRRGWALDSLAPMRQLLRLPLLALTHIAGLSVGIESPSASLGASTLLALRPHLPALQFLPLPLVVAIGGGAGLGAAFRSPLLGVAYALEELSAERGLPLVLPTLVMAGVGTALSSRLGQPARLATGLPVRLDPHLWPAALALTLLAAALGVLFVRLLVPLAARLNHLLRRHFLGTTLLLVLGLGALAWLSGGISLNDGSLALGPALAGRPSAPWWSALPRFLSSLLSIAIGAPGGLMHDCMSLGALVAAPLVRALAADQQAALCALSAAALFSGATRTPLFCGLFVFTLQGNPLLIGPLLLSSALATGLGRLLGGATWNEAQREGAPHA